MVSGTRHQEGLRLSFLILTFSITPETGWTPELFQKHNVKIQKLSISGSRDAPGDSSLPSGIHQLLFQPVGIPVPASVFLKMSSDGQVFMSPATLCP
ncbi:hypothetical protein NQZ68_034178 [Dissostichus eleginoides]|nr:hypothetical protein NQZ68_034178 [Dissostichus eleginoides]